MVLVFFFRRRVVGVKPQDLFGFIGQPLFSDGRVRTSEGAECSPVKFVVVNLRGSGRPIFADLIEFFLHVFVATYPSVVIDVCIGQGGFRVAPFFVIGRNQPILAIGCITSNGVANQPAFTAVLARADRHPVSRAIKVAVVKYQGFNVGVVVVAINAGAHGGQVFFMHHLIAFQIKGPVTGAGVLRNHLLLGIHKTPIGHAFIPQCFDDADFGVTDGPDTGQCVVRPLAHRHEKFIDQWQQGTNRCFKWKAQVNAVAYESKTTDRGRRLGNGSGLPIEFEVASQAF